MGLADEPTKALFDETFNNLNASMAEIRAIGQAKSCLLTQPEITMLKTELEKTLNHSQQLESTVNLDNMTTNAEEAHKQFIQQATKKVIDIKKVEDRIKDEIPVLDFDSANNLTKIRKTLKKIRTPMENLIERFSNLNM